jgi:hypothetical protein
MRAILAGQQFPGSEDLLIGTQEFLSEIQSSELELVYHDWIEWVEWVLDNDGGYFHESTFYDHHSFQSCPDRRVATTYRPLIFILILHTRGKESPRPSSDSVTQFT